jgi:ABC-2 type transport system permease protein
MRDRVRAVIAERKVLRLLIVRDLKIKYADSYLGWLWSIIDPLLMAIVYWFVFTKIFTRPSDTEPYIVFLLMGILPWQWTNSAIHSSTNAISSQAKLVRSTNIPREVWVLRVVGSKFSEFVLSVPIVIFFMILLSVTPGRFTFTVPLAMFLQAMLLTGIGLAVAPIAVMVPDLERLMRIILRVLFYFSPILYGLHNVPEQYRWLYNFNPFAGQLDLYRASVFPEQFGGWTLVISSACWSVFALIAGAVIFVRLEKPVLKEI